MDSVKVNDILRENVVKVTNDLVTVDCPNMSTARLYTQKLEALIDDLGTRSAHEQCLTRVITTTDKLRNSDHILYLLKDPSANNGAGEAIGLLKVGRKKLFLYDAREQVIEVEPLCILDFFITNNYQRRGMGRRLFDYMLRDQNVRPVQLAIDGPSQPMTEFLVKYGMKTLIKQNNNFAVVPDFFQEVKHIRHHGIDRQAYIANNPEDKNKNSHAASTGHAAQASASSNYGRFAAHQRPSQMGKVIHGGGNEFNFKANNASSQKSQMETTKTSNGTGRHAYDQNLESPAPLTLDVSHDVGDSYRTSSNQPSPHERGTMPSHMSPAYQDRSRAGSVEQRNDNMMTAEGHMDLKFHHKKLW